MRSDATRRVSSQVRARAAPAGASFPLISTSGGLPGVKKRSLIFDDVLNIVARSAGVAIGATAGAAAVAATGAVLGTTVAGEDMGAVVSSDKKIGFLRV